MQVNSTWNMWVLSKSSLKWFPHSQYMISLLLIRGIPIESLYQQFPANFTLEIRVWIFQNYRDCRYTCNPHKFEFPALWFPRRDPVNPCKHLQCAFYFCFYCCFSIFTSLTFYCILLLLLLFFHRHPSGWRMFPDRPLPVSSNCATAPWLSWGWP